MLILLLLPPTSLMIKAIIVVATNVPKSKAGLLLETDELMIVADEVVTLDIIVYFLINIDFEYLMLILYRYNHYYYY